MRLRLSLVSLLLLCLTGGCAPSPSALPVMSMKIGSREYTLEVAATPASQETGLMRRDSMPADHGMIFIFPDEQVLTFWMKNTRFPLDIIFCDHGGRVVSVHQMQAYDESYTSSDAPAQYAIELNRNAASEAGVHAGDQLVLPPLPSPLH